MVTIALSAKAIASMITGMCASSLTRSIVKSQFQPENAFQHAQVWIGSAAIGGLVGDAVMTRTDRKFTEYQAIYEKIKAEAEKQSKS